QSVPLANISLGSIPINLPMQGEGHSRAISPPAASPGSFTANTSTHSSRQVIGGSSSVGGGNFPVNSALMIGDYVTPGSIVLPTQGIQLGSHSGVVGSDRSLSQ
ncbi:hypothetical protein SK128_015571, partial [Halocaridina rubra]